MLEFLLSLSLDRLKLPDVEESLSVHQPQFTCVRGGPGGFSARVLVNWRNLEVALSSRMAWTEKVDVLGKRRRE